VRSVSPIGRSDGELPWEELDILTRFLMAVVILPAVFETVTDVQRCKHLSSVSSEVASVHLIFDRSGHVRHQPISGRTHDQMHAGITPGTPRPVAGRSRSTKNWRGRTVASDRLRGGTGCE
jgi:hypothetical protein